MMQLRPYQIEAKQAVLEQWDKGCQKTLLILPTGCHASGEQLLLADGSTKCVDDIRIGDRLLGADGQPRNVLYTQTGQAALYRVVPLKGKPFTVTGDHKLTLIRTNEASQAKYPCERLGGEIIDVPVAEWLTWPRSRKHLYKLLRCSGIDVFPDAPAAPALPIDPYSLAVRSIADKFVPRQYRCADRQTRLTLIAGLLDTDGSLSRNGYDFISKSRQLADDLAFMCRSVGLAAYVSACTKRCQGGYSGTYYRVSISGDCTIIPCRVAHKKAPARASKKSVLRTGFTVEPAGFGQYFGFTVDGDNRYLLDDFTITHNCGKTVVFSSIAEEQVRKGNRVLIMAHRGELLTQAADKLRAVTGMESAVEKAESCSLGSMFPVTVGSVQTLCRERRLSRFPADYYDTIIVDEAHHCLADSYQRVLSHFPEANVLGVTATPDKLLKKQMGRYFDSLAYEYSMRQAIKDKYLCPIKAQLIPLDVDIRGVGIAEGDYRADDIGCALEPYLEQIADEMLEYCRGRKTVVFLPLVSTSQKFCDMLIRRGFRAAEVNGESPERAQILADFDAGRYDVLTNSMLLTEGWDCPSVDCIINLRPTKVRSLYQQIIGRGLRPFPGKEYLLVLDFLWLTERHDLCRPSCLVGKDEAEAAKVDKMIAETPSAVDLMEAEEQVERDAISKREKSLARQLAEMRSRSRRLVDPIQFALSVAAEDLANYSPTFAWEMAPPSQKQLDFLEKRGIYAAGVENMGKASMLIDRLMKRQKEGLSTPKQIRLLERYGFRYVGTWSFEAASKTISRLAALNWKLPYGFNPATYLPK